VTINDYSQTGIERFLQPGEQLLWSGEPRQGIFLRSIDAVRIPYTLMVGGFAILWLVTAIVGGAPGFFVLWGIPFVCVGLYMIFGRFFLDAHFRAGTEYAITDQRVLVSDRKGLSALELRHLPELSLKEHSDGTGTIAFGRTSFYTNLAVGFPWPMRYVQIPTMFEHVSEAHQLYQMISAHQPHRRH